MSMSHTVGSLDSVEDWPAHDLLAPNPGNLMRNRYLAKKVMARKVVDDMSTDLGWTLEGPGSLAYGNEKVRTGSRSLVFAVPSRDEDYIAKNRTTDNGSFESAGQGGAAWADLRYETPQDWSDYNRLAVWVYPERPGGFRTWMMVNFADESSQGFEAPYDPSSFHEAELIPGQWNHVVWEIPEFARANVTRLSFKHSLNGGFGADAVMTRFHIDSIELQQVEAEPTDGWAVAPGTIAFSHVGYQPGEEKHAVVGGDLDGGFEVIDPFGELVYSGELARLETAKGVFRVADFTELRRPGRYRLRAGESESREFTISDEVWLEPVDKILNHFYGMRCGPEIPGVHPRCHFDVVARYGDEVRVVNGGWHDASDLHQNADNTHYIVLAFLEVIQNLLEEGDHPDLCARAIEEACWGIDWSLRTRFGEGVRVTRNLNRFYSDNIVGNADDTVIEAVFSPHYSTIAALTLARAARVLKDVDPERAERCRLAALEDYRAVFEGPDAWTPTNWGPSMLGMGPRVGVYMVNNAAAASMCAAEMHRLTGDEKHAERAVGFAEKILDCQELLFDGSSVTGYLYEDAHRTDAVHDALFCYQQLPITALAELCELFPTNERWPAWYGAIAVHTKYYLGAGAAFTAPFRHLPDSVWTREEEERWIARQYDLLEQRVPDEARAAVVKQRAASSYEAQFAAATPVSESRRLRTFMVEIGGPSVITKPDQRHVKTHVTIAGQGRVQLSQAVGLAAAARVRNDQADEELAKDQLRFTFGLNPFSRSIMWGVGYNTPDIAAGASCQLVGTIPVGIRSRVDDAPYMGSTVQYCAGEIWGITNAVLLMTMAKVGKHATMTGQAPVGATVTDASGRVWKVDPGDYRILLPSGAYRVSFGDRQRDVSLVGGRELRLDLDPERYIASAELSYEPADSGTVTVRAHVSGRGTFSLGLSLFNAAGDVEPQSVTLSDRPCRLQWTLRPAVPDGAWGAMLLGDGPAAPVAEVFGGAAPSSSGDSRDAGRRLAPTG